MKVKYGFDVMFYFFNNDDDIIWIGNGTNFTDKENLLKIHFSSNLHNIRSLVRLPSTAWATATGVPSLTGPSLTPGRPWSPPSPSGSSYSASGATSSRSGCWPEQPRAGGSQALNRERAFHLLQLSREGSVTC